MHVPYGHIEKDGFGRHGTASSRIVGFYAAAFGFALSLLVLSSEVPHSYDQFRSDLTLPLRKKRLHLARRRSARPPLPLWRRTGRRTGDYKMKRNPEGKILDAERLQRISYIVGIYKALRILYGKDLGNRFMHLPNSNRMFNGSTPLEYMKKGGLLAMQDVRRLLDARRGGI